MQQFFWICYIAGHDQRQIEYVCVLPECNSSRFACSKCVKMGNHKHQKQDYSHVLDNKELYEFLKEKLLKRPKQNQQVSILEGDNLQTQPLKQIIQLIQNSLKNMLNMIEQLEQGMDYNNNNQLLNHLLLKLRNNGFAQFDEAQMNILMNIDSQIGGINTILLDQSNSIIQNAKRIQKWCYSQQQDFGLQQKIKDSKCIVITQDQIEGVQSSTISNDFKYIISSGKEQILKIWDYSNNILIKQILFDSFINIIKFTDDSRFLYVGTGLDLYQLDVNNDFKYNYKSTLNLRVILNICCITNTIILIAYSDKTIIKTDVNLKQQLLLIKAHNDRIFGLDYNHNLNVIASTSFDGSIKIWDGNNGQLVLEKQNANNNNNYVNQVLFIIKENKLISQDYKSTIIWKINYEAKQLEQEQQIIDKNQIVNISLVLNQQFITLVCSEYIKIYSIQGDFIKQFNHHVKDFYMYMTIQPVQMKAIIIQGQKILQICKLELELD